MTIQSYEPAVRHVKSRVKIAKRRGFNNIAVGSVFRELRANVRFSLFGDYPLLGIAADEIQKAGFEVRRGTLFKVMRQSEELSQLSQKDRIALANQLLGLGGEH